MKQNYQENAFKNSKLDIFPSLFLSSSRTRSIASSLLHLSPSLKKYSQIFLYLIDLHH